MTKGIKTQDIFIAYKGSRHIDWCRNKSTLELIGIIKEPKTYIKVFYSASEDSYYHQKFIAEGRNWKEIPNVSKNYSQKHHRQIGG